MMDSEEMKKYDKDKLSEILNIRKFIFQDDEKSAEFLENIDNKRPVFKEIDKAGATFLVGLTKHKKENNIVITKSTKMRGDQ